MMKILDYYKGICADMLSCKALSHPILLTAVFLTAKYGVFWLIVKVMPDQDLDFIGGIFLYFVINFLSDGCFLIFCSYLLFCRNLTYKFYIAWFMILSMSLMFDNYVSVDIFTALSIPICVYFLSVSIVLKSFLPIAYAIVYLLSYCIVIFIVIKSFVGDCFIIILYFACPLAWAFYFKYAFKRRYMRNIVGGDKISDDKECADG